jgi:hypothetical protein
MFELILEEKDFPKQKIVEKVVLGRGKEGLEVKIYDVYLGNDGYFSLPRVTHTAKTGK